MKQIWLIIGVACVLISSIGRMANSLTDVLIAVGAIALVALVIWLFETGRLRINERLSKVLKKIGVFILVAVGIAYLVAMVSFVTYKVATEGDLQGIMFLVIATVAFGISWYISRWRRRWVKILKTFMPKDKICHGDWKMREKYFQTLVIFDQGAFGAYADLRIINSKAEHIESISIRAEDATPTIDSIKGKDVYVSYRNFPWNDTILTYDRVMLGESLIDHDKLKFNYHFRNIK